MTELVESKKGRVLDHLATYPVVVTHKVKRTQCSLRKDE